jgi:putative oxidoreductase
VWIPYSICEWRAALLSNETGFGMMGGDSTRSGPEAGASIMRKLFLTQAAAAVILIRLMVGAVFVSEGLQKFLYPAEVGAGRFEKIGIPSPEVVAPIVASFEIGCGTLVLLGLGTRLAVVPLIAIMLTAIATTKIPILMEQGFWKMAHEARTDWSMLLGSIFLLVVGAGPLSCDAKLSAERQE